MCLATVIKKADGTAIFRNVSRIDVNGDTLVIRDILGEEKEVTGKILIVDLANSVVEVECS